MNEEQSLAFAVVSAILAAVAIVVSFFALRRATRQNDLTAQANALHERELEAQERRHKEQSDAHAAEMLSQERRHDEQSNAAFFVLSSLDRRAAYIGSGRRFELVNMGLGVACRVRVVPTSVGRSGIAGAGITPSNFARSFDFVHPRDTVTLWMEPRGLHGKAAFFNSDYPDDTATADFEVTWVTPFGVERSQTVRYAREEHERMIDDA